MDFFEILFQLDMIGLRERGYAIFTEITDPKNWPGTGDFELCWLHVIRENTKSEYEQGQPFLLPPTYAGIDFNRFEYCPNLFGTPAQGP